MPSLQPVIYLDIAALRALLCDLAWLWATAVLAGVPLRIPRLLLGTTGAAAFELLADLRPYWLHPVWAVPLAYTLVYALVLLVTFGLGPWQRWLRLVVAAVVAGCLMTGGSTLLVPTRGVAVVRVGAGAPTIRAQVTANSAAVVLAQVGIVLVLAAGIRLWRGTVRRGQGLASGVWLQVTLGGVQAGLPAFVDTGNQLREPVSGDPVVVCEAQALIRAGCLPPDVGRALATGSLLALPAGWQPRCRLVPMRTVGGRGAHLLALRPEAVAVRRGTQFESLMRCWIALCGEPLHPEGRFVAIVPPAAFGESPRRMEGTGSGF